MTITSVILFGVGSPLLADVEESLYRAGIPIAAGVRNRAGPSHLSDGVEFWSAENFPAALLDLPFLVPIFTPAYRQIAAREALNLGLRRPFTLVDPTVVAPRQLALGEGSYVNAGCTLGAGIVSGPFALVNRGANVGHHVRLGAFVSIGPGVVVAGQVTIDSGCMIGTGATILPGVSIGDNAVIGAGSVVTKDVPAGCLAIGSPARIAREGIGGYRGLPVGGLPVDGLPVDGLPVS
jgi:sugar O-acyltransferase (sialic acid O-acetyltransferase NeuD family)